MTARTLDVVLRREAEGTWTSEALALPSARITAVLDQSGAPVPFEVRNGKIAVEQPPSSLVARVELQSAFVAADELVPYVVDFGVNL